MLLLSKVSSIWRPSSDYEQRPVKSRVSSGGQAFAISCTRWIKLGREGVYAISVMVNSSRLRHLTANLVRSTSSIRLTDSRNPDSWRHFSPVSLIYKDISRSMSSCIGVEAQMMQVTRLPMRIVSTNWSSLICKLTRVRKYDAFQVGIIGPSISFSWLTIIVPVKPVDYPDSSI